MPVSQEQIVCNTQAVRQTLAMLKADQEQYYNSLRSAADEGQREDSEAAMAQLPWLQQALERIEQGLDEADIIMSLSQFLQHNESERQKLKSQVRRLVQENAWLREELAEAQNKLQRSEEARVQLEEEKVQLQFMQEMRKYDQEAEERESAKQRGPVKPSDLTPGFRIDAQTVSTTVRNLAALYRKQGKYCAAETLEDWVQRAERAKKQQQQQQQSMIPRATSGQQIAHSK